MSSSKVAAILVALIVIVGVVQVVLYTRSRDGAAPSPAVSTTLPGPGTPPGPGGPPGGGPAPWGQRPGFQPPAVPAHAPDFTLPTASGGEVHLKSLLEKGPVLLCFFKIECQTSQLAVPKYEVFQSWYAARAPGFTIVGIVQNAAQEAAFFAQQRSLGFPMAVDAPPYSVSGSYGIINTPTLVLVGADGKTLKVVPSWNRSGVNALAQEIAKLTGVEYHDVSTAQDGLPDMQPG